MKRILLFMLFFYPLTLAGVSAQAGISLNLLGEYQLTPDGRKALAAQGFQHIDKVKSLHMILREGRLAIELLDFPQINLSPGRMKSYEFINKKANCKIQFIFENPDQTSKVTGLIVSKDKYTASYAKADLGETVDNSGSVPWERREPDGVNMDPSKIEVLLDKIQIGHYRNVHGLIIIKNGFLILESYFNGSSANHLHQMRSATKSIGSMLLGIAIDNGFIKGIDEPVVSFFPEYEPPQGWNLYKKAISIKSLLSMTSGIGCYDWVDHEACSEMACESDNWLQFVLELPMADRPGKVWAYNTASLILLGEIISRTSKMSIPDFTHKYLFNPLKIKDSAWLVSPNGVTHVGMRLRLKARDMAKIGSLCLHRGQWEGRQIVSQNWMEVSTKEHMPAPVHFYPWHRNTGYGFLWWCKTFTIKDRRLESYFASGGGGQVIFVLPKLETVVVFTSGNYGKGPLHDQPIEIMENDILPAMVR